MKPRLIKSEEDYNEALSRIDELMELDPELESDEGRELELLSLLVEQYEDTVYPIDMPGPVDAIKFRMEQEGLKQADLIDYIGSKSKVSEVLNGKRPLSLAMMRNLNEGLGIPASVLLQKPVEVLPEVRYRVREFPMAEMVKRHYFSWFSGTLPQAKECGEELLTRFFSIFNGAEPQPVYCRKSGTTMNEKSLLAWQARTSHLAKTENLPEFSRESLGLEAAQGLAKLSYLKEGPKMAIEFLNKKGIHVILLSHLKGTYLDGASFWGPHGNPVIGLTLRHDRLDNFWFTLFHELGHVILHLNVPGDAFFDDMDNVLKSKDSRELEANEFASNSLIPEEIWEKNKARLVRSPSSEKVVQFAEALNIHHAVVAGRIRWHKHDYSMFPDLVGSREVRKIFES